MRKTYNAETAIDAPPIRRPAPIFRQEPARTPTVQSDVVVPALRSAITGAGVGICTACVALMTGIPTPGAFAGIGFAAAATGSWLLDVAELKRLMWRIEERLERDFDGDSQVGQPAPIPADRLVPVFYDRNTKVVDEPAPPQIDEDDRPLRLLPSDRAMPKCEVFDYVEAAFSSGDWTRDGRPSNINTKEWSDLRGFVRAYYPRVWETTDRPTLDWFIRKIRNTGAN